MCFICVISIGVVYLYGSVIVCNMFRIKEGITIIKFNIYEYILYHISS